MSALPPDTILRQIAQAMPVEVRGDIIIIGSLAAGYHFFGDDPEAAVMTKDVDCLLSPNARAVQNGKAVAERLLREGWRVRKHGEFENPGDATTPLVELPFIRLSPPGNPEWFLELNASPPAGQSENKRLDRIATTHGDFAIFSFRFLALAEEEPLPTPYGIHVARPEMMVLANLMHHPKISHELIANTTDKRSNKDLGRVLALAHLATARDETALPNWADRWLAALTKRFPDDWPATASQAGNGLRALLASPPDLEQAARLCNDGLLARRPLAAAALAATGRRLLVDAVAPLEAAAGDKSAA
jgi:hypothetical protein